LEKPTTRPAPAEVRRGELQSSPVWLRAREAFYADGQAGPVHRALTEAVDALILEAYQGDLARQSRVAMSAIGGYGRSKLYPYSNVELVFLCEGVPPAALKEAVARFVQTLWEKGLRPNPRVVTIAEALEFREQNIDLPINLLHRRFLAGDRGIYDRFEQEMPGFLSQHGRPLAEQLGQLTRARHARFRNTPNHREPDVKDGPGGLRDLHLIARLAILQPEAATAWNGLEEATAQIESLRCFLHYQAERDRNLMDLGAQQELARRPFAGSLPIRDFFGHARDVYRRSRQVLDRTQKSGPSLLDQAQESESRLSNGEFTVLHGKVFLRRPADFSNEPEAVFRLLEFVARHGIPPAPDTESRLDSIRGALAEHCAGPKNLWGTLLRPIFSLPHGGTALRIARDLTLLRAIFPELADTEGVIAGEADQKFTLDEHALLAIEKVDELQAAGPASSQRFAELCSEIDDVSLLRFALLFRGAGLRPSGDWPQYSAAIAGKAADRVRMPASDEKTVEFVLENQLQFTEAASGRDLDDPATARLLAERMGTIERAKLLAVFSYAEIAATDSSDNAEWRVEQLRQTESLVERELTRELETERISELPPALPVDAEFIRGFPTRYLRARNVAEIEEHAKLYEGSRDPGVAVDLIRLPGAYRLTVVARDVPFLFASFAGAISSFGLEILKAEAFANARGVVLDTFVLADPKRTLELNPPEADRLQDLIRRIALGKTDARRLLRNQPRPDPSKRSFAPQIRFDAEACATATLVEIVAEDRPGLLYSLATAISSAGFNIDVVLIDTKGRRAIDVFYIAREGRKLTTAEQDQLRGELLAVC
jgi:[protein-PII] uridylyltransferase